MESKKFLAVILGAMMLCPSVHADINWGKLILGSGELLFGLGGAVVAGKVSIDEIIRKRRMDKCYQGYRKADSEQDNIILGATESWHKIRKEEQTKIAAKKAPIVGALHEFLLRKGINQKQIAALKEDDALYVFVTPRENRIERFGVARDNVEKLLNFIEINGLRNDPEYQSLYNAVVTFRDHRSDGGLFDHNACIAEVKEVRKLISNDLNKFLLKKGANPAWVKNETAGWDTCATFFSFFNSSFTKSPEKNSYIEKLKNARDNKRNIHYFVEEKNMVNDPEYQSLKSSAEAFCTEKNQSESVVSDATEQWQKIYNNAENHVLNALQNYNSHYHHEDTDAKKNCSGCENSARNCSHIIKHKDHQKEAIVCSTVFGVLAVVATGVVVLGAKTLAQAFSTQNKNE